MLQTMFKLLADTFRSFTNFQAPLYTGQLDMYLCPLCRDTHEYTVLHYKFYQASEGQEVFKKAKFIQLTPVYKIAWTREVGFICKLLDK